MYVLDQVVYMYVLGQGDLIPGDRDQWLAASPGPDQGSATEPNGPRLLLVRGSGRYGWLTLLLAAPRELLLVRGGRALALALALEHLDLAIVLAIVAAGLTLEVLLLEVLLLEVLLLGGIVGVGGTANKQMR